MREAFEGEGVQDTVTDVSRWLTGGVGHGDDDDNHWKMEDPVS